MKGIWLIGMMGAGKSKVGRAVAGDLGLPFVDTDAQIEEEAGRSIADIWTMDGEERFRDLEAVQIDAIVRRDEDCVIATGGGVVLRGENVRAMRNSGLVVWLTGEPTTLARRLAGDDARPLLADEGREQRLMDILAQREDLYRAAAHHVVDTTGKQPGLVAEEVSRLWNAS